ncbi:hypothetical protein GCT19_31505 [Paraburkholderia sp. CNPSo 3155]|uniref:hypothetical protein n=1 Tax=Paraburkholderia atlantica TaxID=2654982 RepID=UPI00128CFCDE|nr:hypothetical protein [Paraburkholderia atlantica]MPW10115.1 hypothetical protein [Paraburkholderia atlantica]
MTQGLKRHVLRQLTHWEGAAERLDDFEASATPEAWASVERRVGVTLRRELKDAREQLKREAAVVRAGFSAAQTRPEFERLDRQVARLRERYMRTELLVDFFVDAVRSRANPELGAQLRACDVMAHRAISQGLEYLGETVPPVMTYFKPGLGAAILRWGTPLWDGSLSQIAAIKVTYHNRFRTTALLHESGHQFAAVSGWNEAFQLLLVRELSQFGTEIAEQVASWATEIAADAFAFAHSGFAAVVAVSDVISGTDADAFRFIPGDPHPIAYLRVMLGVEMCRQFYGMGPWDELAESWTSLHQVARADAFTGAMIGTILPLLPRVVKLSLLAELPCFRGRRLADLVDPQRVAPTVLRQMQREAGAAAFTSSHWIWTECLRLTALSGLRFATEPELGREILKQQEALMVKLGQLATEHEVA